MAMRMEVDPPSPHPQQQRQQQHEAALLTPPRPHHPHANHPSLLPPSPAPSPSSTTSTPTSAMSLSYLAPLPVPSLTPLTIHRTAIPAPPHYPSAPSPPPSYRSPVRANQPSSSSSSSPALRSPQQQGSPPSGDKECWVCLGGEESEPLERMCKCPSRRAHRRCWGRWCLQQAGRREERQCRFCSASLPDFRAALGDGLPQPSTPIMSVHFGNQTHLVRVEPGEAGRLKFEADVRRLLGLQPDQAFYVNFECHAPEAMPPSPPAAGSSGTGPGPAPAAEGPRLDLKGLETYDTAVWLAGITAAKRQQQQAARERREREEREAREREAQQQREREQREREQQQKQQQQRERRNGVLQAMWQLSEADLALEQAQQQREHQQQQREHQQQQQQQQREQQMGGFGSVFVAGSDSSMHQQQQQHVGGFGGGSSSSSSGGDSPAPMLQQPYSMHAPLPPTTLPPSSPLSATLAAGTGGGGGGGTLLTPSPRPMRTARGYRVSDHGGPVPRSPLGATAGGSHVPPHGRGGPQAALGSSSSGGSGGSGSGGGGRQRSPVGRQGEGLREGDDPRAAESKLRRMMGQGPRGGHAGSGGNGGGGSSGAASSMAAATMPLDVGASSPRSPWGRSALVASGGGPAAVPRPTVPHYRNAAPAPQQCSLYRPANTVSSGGSTARGGGTLGPGTTGAAEAAQGGWGGRLLRTLGHPPPSAPSIASPQPHPPLGGPPPLPPLQQAFAGDGGADVAGASNGVRNMSVASNGDRNVAAARAPRGGAGGFPSRSPAPPMVAPSAAAASAATAAAAPWVMGEPGSTTRRPTPPALPREGGPSAGSRREVREGRKGVATAMGARGGGSLARKFWGCVSGKK